MVPVSLPHLGDIGAERIASLMTTVVDLGNTSHPIDPLAAVDLLVEVGETIGAAMDLNEALERLAGLAMRATGAERCGVFLVDPPGSMRLAPVVGAVRAGNPRILRRQFRQTPPIDVSLNETWQELWRHPAPVLIDDAVHSTLIPRAWRAWNSKSLAFSPLRAHGESFGLVAVDYVSRRHAFSREEGRLLDAIACAAGTALRSARLVAEVRRGLEIRRRLFECSAILRSAESVTRLLDLVADGFAFLLRLPHVSIYLLDEPEERLLGTAHRGSRPVQPEYSIADLPALDVARIRAAWAADPHLPLVIPHVRELREWRELIAPEIDVGLLVPLAADDRLLGLVVAGRAGDRFDAEELTVARAFADHAAVAVARAHAEERTIAQARVTHAISRVSDLAHGTTDLRSLLKSMNTILADVGIECVRVSFAEECLRELLGLPAPSEEDADALARWRKTKASHEEPVSTRDGLLLPIMIQGRVAGALCARVERNLLEQQHDLIWTIASAFGDVAYKAKLRRTSERRAIDLALAAERERIARDLHDTIGQTLYGIGLRLQELILDVEDRELVERLAELRTLASQGVADVRSTVYAMSFLHVRARGFVGSLRALCRQFTRSTGVLARLDVNGVPRLVSEETKSAIYRMVHEALVNVDRHARATGVVINLRRTGDDLTLTIRDDGVGLDQRQVREWRSAAHFGLRTMARSIREVGGRFSVASAEPRGLKLCAVVPIRRPRA